MQIVKSQGVFFWEIETDEAVAPHYRRRENGGWERRLVDSWEPVNDDESAALEEAWVAYLVERYTKTGVTYDG